MKGLNDYLIALLITLSLHLSGAVGYELLSSPGRESLPRPEMADNPPVIMLFSRPLQSPRPETPALPTVLPVENIDSAHTDEIAESPAMTASATPVEIRTTPPIETQKLKAFTGLSEKPPAVAPHPGLSQKKPRYHKPELLNEIRPRYPLAARQQEQEGVVKLQAWIKSSGRVDRVETLISSGHPLLDRAALKAVKKARFKPAEMNSRAVEGSVIISICFQLDH
ncbi:hypothetical protein ES705_50547 [subsurface metagenome]